MSRRLPEDLVYDMHAEYRRGLSLSAVARMYGRSPVAVRNLFNSRGLAIRPDPRGTARRLPDGRIAPLPRIGLRDIDRMCAGLTKIKVPGALKPHWRNWPLSVRGAFIVYLRERLDLPASRPETPFSANVEPFDYGTPRAWEVVSQLNVGRNSRTAAAKLNLCSQGVIWDERLWFWVFRGGVGYVLGIGWTPEFGRPLLTHAIWERAHRRAIPASHVVVSLDGNRNNLAPENLVLKSRADLAIENKQSGVRKREHTANFFRMHAGAAALLARSL